MILSHDDQTIVAQCTPNGSGAIALLRISGLTAIPIAAKIAKLASSKSLLDAPTHTIHLGWVIDSHQDHIDQVMFLVMHGPKTFTGQDIVEITCHNNPFIIQSILQACIEHGARMAQEGEFTKRAVLNNKIDLIQAEAICELIHANTQLGLKKSLSQLEGSFSHWIMCLEKEIVKALAYCQASFEFIDEEMTFGQKIKDILISTIQTIHDLKKTFNQQLHIRQGIRIAIIGSVNAGKSSLFNALLQKERAIVTEIAGTTRDAIEAGIYKKDCYWTLIDTAGLRQTYDIVEQEGIKRSHKEAQQADIIILVFDGSRRMTDQEYFVYDELLVQYKNKIICVQNKSDLPSFENDLLAQQFCVVQLSNYEQRSHLILEQYIEKMITTLMSQHESSFLLNHRHYNLLLGLEKSLLEVLAMFDQTINPAYELVSYQLNDALAHVSELTGKSISEQTMDAVFKEFCVGK